ncbi:MAG: hypothetical protein ABH804_00230 [archaeon]
MVEKNKSESLGISGFTLSIAGMFSLILVGPFSIPMFIAGLIFCWIQHKRKPTKLSRAGIIINGVGIIISLILLWFVIKQITVLLNSGALAG